MKSLNGPTTSVPRGITAEYAYDEAHWPQATPAQRRGMQHLRHGLQTRPHFVAFRVDDLPAAAFTDSDPATGSMVVAMAMEPRASGHDVPTTRLYAGTVLYAGVSIGQGDGFCATGVATPMPAGDLGSPLVDGTGAVPTTAIRRWARRRPPRTRPRPTPAPRR